MGYAAKKGENLSDKEGIKEITYKIEEVRSEYTNQAE
jgi:hypothetical protein